MLFDPTQDIQYLDCFKDTVSILSKTTSSPLSNTGPTYSTTYANVPALILRAGGQLQVIYEQRNIHLSHRILVQYTIPDGTVNTGDIVAFGSRQFVIEDYQRVLESGTLFALFVREIFGSEMIYEG